jgi:hypothetical protein
VCDALTLDDLRDNDFPHLAHYAETGAVGVMNCAVAGPKTPTAATLTLAVGQQARGEPTDEQAFNGWETVAGERGTAREVFARRIGLISAGNLPYGIVHLGFASLMRRGLAEERLGAALAQARPPVRTLVLGSADTDIPGRRAALLTVDAAGRGSGVLPLSRQAAAAPFRRVDDPVRLMQAALESDADCVVIQLGDTARAEALRPRLAPVDYLAARKAALRRLNILLFLLVGRLEQEGEQADLLLVSPYPPSDDTRHPAAWGRLPPILARGPHFPPGLLASATTRTPGLVANTDIAPTILRLLDASVPLTMVGRPLRSVPAFASGPMRVAAVARLEYIAALNGRATVPILLPLGAACVFLVFGAMIARRRGGTEASRRFAPGFVFFLTLPTALLLAPLLVPPTLFEYGLRIVAWMLILTAACYLAAQRLRVSPPVVAAFLGMALVAGDTLAGQPLLKDSLFSSYPLSGIRYYGVGNEYLGALLGFALAGGFAWLDDRRLPYPPGDAGRGPRLLLALGWLLLMLLLGWPGLGANAGSLAATGAGFGVGAAILRGRRPTVRLALACIAAGLLLAFAFSALDAALAQTGGVSHSGAAIRAASEGRGPGYLAQIAARKIAMNLRLLLTPWILLAAAVIAGTMLAAQALIGDALKSVLQRRPWMARGWAAIAAAAGAALVFKDSGVVTVAFLIGGACLILLYYSLVPCAQKPMDNASSTGVPFRASIFGRQWRRRADPRQEADL